MKFGKVYITITQVAAVLGWSRQRTTKWLEESGALVSIGKGRRIRRYTTRTLLRNCFPDIYREILDTEYEEKDF